MDHSFPKHLRIAEERSILRSSGILAHDRSVGNSMANEHLKPAVVDIGSILGGAGRLIGSAVRPLDGKRRVTVGADLLPKLGEMPVAAPWADGCCALLPRPLYMLILDLMAEEALLHGDAAWALRLFASLASIVDQREDSGFRVTLPEPLLAFAEVTTEALVLGAGWHVEIWNPARYAARSACAPRKESSVSDLPPQAELLASVIRRILGRFERRDKPPFPAGAGAVSPA